MPLAIVRSSVGPPINGLLFSFPGDPAPAVILLHDARGLDEATRATATKLAGEGFLVLALDLFGGRTAPDDAQAQALAGQLQAAAALAQIHSSARWISGVRECNGKVGLVGLGLGGALALSAACEVPGLSGVVAFYGLPAAADWSKIEAPILGHYALHDPAMDPGRLPALRAALQAVGAQASIQEYDAGHGFLREGDPAWSAASAELAWSRTTSFLREKLA